MSEFEKPAFVVEGPAIPSDVFDRLEWLGNCYEHLTGQHIDAERVTITYSVEYKLGPGQMQPTGLMMHHVVKEERELNKPVDVPTRDKKLEELFGGGQSEQEILDSQLRMACYRYDFIYGGDSLTNIIVKNGGLPAMKLPNYNKRQLLREMYDEIERMRGTVPSQIEQDYVHTQKRYEDMFSEEAWNLLVQSFGPQWKRIMNIAEDHMRSHERKLDGIAPEILERPDPKSNLSDKLISEIDKFVCKYDMDTLREAMLREGIIPYKDKLRYLTPDKQRKLMLRMESYDLKWSFE